MKPQLVKDKETGKLCVQITQGRHAATLQLPDDFNTWEEARKSTFLKMFIDEAMKSLKLKSSYKRRKIG